MSDDQSRTKDPVFDVLAVVCWILPLAGIAWGPGSWWAYVLWLVLGTVVMAGYTSRSS